jgi:MraZ protein
MADLNRVTTPDPEFPGVIPPLNFHEAKLDEKGRLKLPAPFQEYFTAIGQTKFFISSLDHTLAQIYTIPGWLKRVEELTSCSAGPRVAANALFIAKKLGGHAEMDSQGRVLIPAALRKALGIENQTVHLQATGSRVDIMSEKAFAEFDLRAMAEASKIADALWEAGIR